MHFSGLGLRTAVWTSSPFSEPQLAPLDLGLPAVSQFGSAAFCGFYRADDGPAWADASRLGLLITFTFIFGCSNMTVRFSFKIAFVCFSALVSALVALRLL